VSENLTSPEALEVILRRLPVRTDFPVSFRSLALGLSYILSLHKPEPTAGPLKPATRIQAISQLRRLEKALKQLDQALAELSNPATVALDQHRQTHSLQWTPTLPQAIRLYLAQSFPGLGEAALAAAKALEAKGPEPEPGRRKDTNIETLMRTLADIFSVVTGSAPTRITDAYKGGRDVGAFAQFVAEIFELAGINRSADREARWAIDDFKDRQKTG